MERSWYKKHGIALNPHAFRIEKLNRWDGSWKLWTKECPTCFFRIPVKTDPQLPFQLDLFQPTPPEIKEQKEQRCYVGVAWKVLSPVPKEKARHCEFATFNLATMRPAVKGPRKSSAVLISKFTEDIYGANADKGRLEGAVEDLLKNGGEAGSLLVKVMLETQINNMMLDSYYHRAARRVFGIISQYGSKSFIPFIANLDLSGISESERLGLEQWIIEAFGTIANRNKGNARPELEEAAKGRYRVMAEYARKYLQE